MKEQAARQNERINYAEVVSLYDELDALKEQHPEIVEEILPELSKKTVLERILQFYLDLSERFHKESRVSKRIYCKLCLLGMFGVHHFYAGHWIKGVLYLAICWSGISAGMTILDWIAAIPKTADEDGMIIV